MTTQSEYVDYLLELLRPFGDVSSRAMFGGHGIYKEGLIFAIVIDDSFYLKADDVNRGEFDRRGLAPCVYESKNKRMKLSLGYYQCPDDALESTTLMLNWARSSYAAALRAAARKQGANKRVAKTPANAVTAKRRSRRKSA